MRELPAALRPADPVPLGQRVMVDGRELCQLLGISDPTLRALVADGLPYVRIGQRNRRYIVTQVAQWLAGRQTTEAGLSSRA